MSNVKRASSDQEEYVVIGTHTIAPFRMTCSARQRFDNEGGEVSESGLVIGKLGLCPAIRRDKVNEIRDSIGRGDYITKQKINSTITAMLPDIRVRKGSDETEM